MLIIFSGLYENDRNVIAKHLTFKLNAVYLNSNSIEYSISKIIEYEKELITVATYNTLYTLVEDNLLLNNIVIVDCINPTSVTRNKFRDIARLTNKKFLEIEVICSGSNNLFINRIKKKKDCLDWHKVTVHQYEPWDRKHLIINTSIMSMNSSIDKIIRSMNI